MNASQSESDPEEEAGEFAFTSQTSLSKLVKCFPLYNFTCLQYIYIYKYR